MPPNYAAQLARYRKRMAKRASGGLGYGAKVGQTITGALGRGAGGRFVRAADRETIAERNRKLRATLERIKAILRQRKATQRERDREWKRQERERKRREREQAREEAKDRAAQRKAQNRIDLMARMVERGMIGQNQADAFLALLEDGADEAALALLLALGLVDADGNLTRAGRLLKTAADGEKLESARRAMALLAEASKEKAGEDAFGRSIRAAARILWKDPYDFVGFVDALQPAIVQWYEQAWREGAKACGVLPEDRTPEEVQKLTEFISVAQNSIFPLAQFIATNAQPNGGKWGDIQARLNIWINRYEEVKSTAQQMSCGDQKLMWVYGDTEHCEDCLRLNGRVYRASIWEKYNLRPRMQTLSCHGYNCQCRFVVTTDPVTPGRPPALAGGGFF